MKANVLPVVVTIVLVVAAVSEARMRCPARTLRRTRLLGVAATLEQDCGGQTVSCASCTAVLTCSRLGDVLRPITQTECPTATPYCSAGQCVADMPSEDCVVPPTATADFVCNGDGYFPDPADCTKYYLCVNSQPYEYSCSQYSGTRYSHAKAMCVPNAEATCSAVRCSTALVGTYQTYGQDSSVYFVCQDTTAANAYVAACPENHVISSSGDCVLTCQRSGRLANTDDNTKYYECIQTGTNTFSQPTPLTCPTGTTFDADSERCD